VSELLEEMGLGAQGSQGEGVDLDALVTEVDESAARRTLRGQIARLESELAELFCSSQHRAGFEWRVPAAAAGPRLLPLAELEGIRDDLAALLGDNRRQLEERACEEERKRIQIERMMLEPDLHRWDLVSNADIGEPGCKHWHVVPRWGPVGMFMNWWRVRISSGCPLPRGHAVTA
jgi:hypothetical protein